RTRCRTRMPATSTRAVCPSAPTTPNTGTRAAAAPEGSACTVFVQTVMQNYPLPTRAGIWYFLKKGNTAPGDEVKRCGDIEKRSHGKGAWYHGKIRYPAGDVSAAELYVSDPHSFVV